MRPSTSSDLRKLRNALALAVTTVALLATVALASGGSGGEVVLPVEPDGGIGN